jgi:hypothetical protein
MSAIPLDLQRRFERRWAGRFQQPRQPAETRGDRLEAQDQQLAAPRKSKRKTRQMNRVGPRSTPAL